MYKVSILGRPNVGKSTLFNRLLMERCAVVHRECGITRDRKSRIITIMDKCLEITDTGGIIFDKNDAIQSLITKQAIYALEESSLIIFVLDVNELLPLDLEILEMLRKSAKNYIVAINKVDDTNREMLLFDFYSRGINRFITISAKQNRNIDLLREEILGFVPVDSKVPFAMRDIPKLCIVGKPNVGKSTFINSLLNKERLIVSHIPGTTRDSVDTLVYYYRQPYLLIDTAGLRKKSRVKNDVEAIFNSATLRSIERSDLVLLMIDCNEGFTNQDHKIINLIEKKGKCLIMVINKWDTIHKDTLTLKRYQQNIYNSVPNLGNFPILSVSALHRTRITHIFKIIDELKSLSDRRISTSKLNSFISSLLNKNGPSDRNFKGPVKIYYAVNTGTRPHKFILWVNKADSIKTNFERFVINRLRKEYKLDGICIELEFKEKTKNV